MSDFTVSQDGWSGPKRLTDGVCGHCKMGVRFVEPDGDSGYWSVETSVRDEIDDVEHREKHSFIAGVCPRPSCRGVTILLETTFDVVGYNGSQSTSRRVIYPLASSRPDLAAEVPDELRTRFSEACNVEFVSATATAFLAGRILEQVLRDETDSNKRLFDLIGAYLEQAVVPDSLHVMMEDVRQFRNVASHAGRTPEGAWVDVDQAEASYVLDLVSELLDFIYVRPKRQAQMRERLKAKKAGRATDPADVGIKVEPVPEAPPPTHNLTEPDDDLPF